MPANFGDSRGAALTQAFIAGLTKQNLGGVLAGVEKRDIERQKQAKLQDTVRDFQLSIGEDKEDQKVFQTLQKRNPGWNRNDASVREFVSNYYTTKATNKSVTDLVNAGVLPGDPKVTNAMREMALNDPEGTGRMLANQSLAFQAAQEKQEREKGEAAAQGQIEGFAVKAAQHPGGAAAFVDQLNVSDGTKFKILKASQTLKDPATAGIQQSNAVRQQAELDRKIKSRDAGVTHAVTQMVKELGANPTDASISDYMADNPDLFKNLSTDVGELSLGIKNQKRLRVIEDNRKQQARIQSEDFMTKLKGSGVTTAGFSKTAFANNVIQFDPTKVKKAKVYEGDPNVVSEGFVGDPTTGLPLVYSEMSDGTFGMTAESMNAPAVFYEMERNTQGNLVTKKGPDGNPVPLPAEAKMLQARKYIEDATKDTDFFGRKKSPVAFVNGMTGKLIKSTKENKDAMMEVTVKGRNGRPFKKKVPNPNTDAGLLLIQLESLENSLTEMVEVSPGSILQGTGPVSRRQAKRFDEDVDASNAAAQGYVLYKALRAKSIGLEAGIFK